MRCCAKCQCKRLFERTNEFLASQSFPALFRDSRPTATINQSSNQSSNQSTGPIYPSPFPCCCYCPRYEVVLCVRCWLFCVRRWIGRSLSCVCVCVLVLEGVCWELAARALLEKRRARLGGRRVFWKRPPPITDSSRRVYEWIPNSAVPLYTTLFVRAYGVVGNAPAGLVLFIGHNSPTGARGAPPQI
jgi:hypothetical protein